jgi:hypothetical protein
LPAASVGHFAAITEPAEVGALLRAIDGFKGTFIVQCALKLAPMLFVLELELTLFRGHLYFNFEESIMPKTHPPYPAEFRQQIIELVRAGRTPAELSIG